MNRSILSKDAPAPFSKYSQAVETNGNVRWLHVSGQVGIAPNGLMPDTFEQQHEMAWKNVFAVLAAADMTVTDIVEVIAIVTDHDQVPIYRITRDRMLEGHECASTMLVCGLANPDWKVEIAIRAAKEA